MITQEQIDDLVQKIIENYHPEKIILFGSYASGNATDDSDLDLLIVKDTSFPIHKRGREIRKFIKQHPFSLDFIVYTPSEFEKHKSNKMSFLNKVLREGKILL
ncbi:MAG TPA: nucleotidyltransferase domain-containing protein [Methanosarcinales archaeon]|nr:nucleotidyltransferase domain-containing protein [Methanosarcinales archaeon]